MSRYNYEAQEAGKTFKISQMIHTKKVWTVSPWESL